MDIPFDVFKIVISAFGMVLLYFLKGVTAKMDENNKNLHDLNTSIAVILERTEAHKGEVKHINKRLDNVEKNLLQLEKEQITCFATCNGGKK